MADFVLTLGGVTFKDFEVPASISAGGQQALAIHKYADGKRTVDAFGPDDDDIVWSGVFLDGTAEARCQQLDTMRRQGQNVTLTWGGFNYLVVVRAFKFEYERFYQIHYSITLAVVQDQTQPASATPSTIEDLMQGDITDALGQSDILTALSSGLDYLKTAAAPLVTAIGDVQTAVTEVNSITGGTIPFLNDLAGKVNVAKGLADGVVSAADGDLSGVGAAANLASGTSPTALATTINQIAAGAKALPAVYSLANDLGRLGKNVAGVTQ